MSLTGHSWALAAIVKVASRTPGGNRANQTSVGGGGANVAVCRDPDAGMPDT